MNHVEAVAIATTGDDLPREKQVEAWQYLIDTGACWHLGVWYEIVAHQLLKLGICNDTATNGER
jgi:hypothetical protein